MTITTRAWRSLIGLLLSMQLIAIVPCATGAEPASPVQWSIQPTAEELQLLQQSLSITELDKEIDRISVQEASTAKERSRTEAELRPAKPPWNRSENKPVVCFALIILENET